MSVAISRFCELITRETDRKLSISLAIGSDPAITLQIDLEAPPLKVSYQTFDLLEFRNMDPERAQTWEYFQLGEQTFGLLKVVNVSNGFGDTIMIRAPSISKGKFYRVVEQRAIHQNECDYKITSQKDIEFYGESVFVVPILNALPAEINTSLELIVTVPKAKSVLLGIYIEGITGALAATKGLYESKFSSSYPVDRCFNRCPARADWPGVHMNNPGTFWKGHLRNWQEKIATCELCRAYLDQRLAENRAGRSARIVSSKEEACDQCRDTDESIQAPREVSYFCDSKPNFIGRACCEPWTFEQMRSKSRVYYGEETGLLTFVFQSEHFSISAERVYPQSRDHTFGKELDIFRSSITIPNYIHETGRG